MWHCSLTNILTNTGGFVKPALVRYNMRKGKQQQPKMLTSASKGVPAIASTQPASRRCEQIEAAALRLPTDEQRSLMHKLIDSAASWANSASNLVEQAVWLTIDDLGDAMQCASANAVGVKIIVTTDQRIKAPGFITATPAKFLTML